MRTVSILLPSLARCATSASVANGTLACWIARGDPLPAAAPGLEGALRALFEWTGQSLPSAALTRQADLGDAQDAVWIRADPAHVRADMTTARMLACGALGLSIDECAALGRDLKPMFGDSGLLLDMPRPDRCYLRALPGSELPSMADPDDVIGDDLKLHLPAGAAGRRWRVLFNEVQVLLHHHAVNAQRARRGAVAVNALWFWGAGRLPDRVRTALTGVCSNDPVILALAGLAGVAVAAPDPDATLSAIDAQREGALLIDLLDQRGDGLETHWLQPLARRLDRRRVDALDLIFASGQRQRVAPMHRWRLWRRLRSVSA